MILLIIIYNIILIKSVFCRRQSTGNESTGLDRRRLPSVSVQKKILVTRIDVDGKAMSYLPFYITLFQKFGTNLSLFLSTILSLTFRSWSGSSPPKTHISLLNVIEQDPRRSQLPKFGSLNVKSIASSYSPYI